MSQIRLELKGLDRESDRYAPWSIKIERALKMRFPDKMHAVVCKDIYYSDNMKVEVEAETNLCLSEILDYFKSIGILRINAEFPEGGYKMGEKTPPAGGCCGKNCACVKNRKDKRDKQGQDKCRCDRNEDGTPKDPTP